MSFIGKFLVPALCSKIRGGLTYFLSLIHTGWSANAYLLRNNRHTQTPTKSAQKATIAPIIYEKEYFFFSAPDDKMDESEALKYILSTVKKRQQIIFIKAPIDDSFEKALENLLQNAVQQKPHIYVFWKEPNYGDLKQKFKQIQQNVQMKPEVHLIKYHNTLEAQRIQSSIIEQYGVASDNKLFYSRAMANDNTPVSKNYAMNFLPAGVDVVPGSSYIPLLLK